MSATDVQPNALLVPQRAILETQGQYQVAVVGADNRVAMRTVKPGKTYGDSHGHCSRGLQPGERVITDGVQKVTDGMEVRPRLRPPSPAARRRAGAIASRRPRPRAAPGAAPRLGAMSKFFINRPIVAMVIAIFFVIAGAVMILRLPVAQFPEIVPPADPDHRGLYRR